MTAVCILLGVYVYGPQYLPVRENLKPKEPIIGDKLREGEGVN